MCLWMPVACVCVRVCAYIYTKPRQQKFRAMNGAHLASTIRGELVMLIGPSWEPNLLPYWAPNSGPIWQAQLGESWLCSLAPAGNPIYCPIGHQIRGPLGKQDLCPNFALTAAKFVFSNSGNFRAKANLPKPRSCPKRPFGQ